jgi:TPR repeat protein
MESSFCLDGSAWACNEYGIFLVTRQFDPESAVEAFRRACAMHLSAGCTNMNSVRTYTGMPISAPPRAEDYSVLLQQGKVPVRQRAPLDLYKRACAQGWIAGCESLAAMNQPR